MLYQREITGESVAHIVETASYNPEEGSPSDFSLDLARGAEEHEAEIDELLQRISEHWSVSRMPLVDRSILRMAAYEILYVDDVPHSVTINEAVELAKVFGGDDSSKFVNGVLGKLAEEIELREGGVEGARG
jgi:N utilization substance protein B